MRFLSIFIQFLPSILQYLRCFPFKTILIKSNKHFLVMSGYQEQGIFLYSVST